MITARKLEVYTKFSGDIDGWARIASGPDARDITEQEWRTLDDLLQRVSLIKNGKASHGFEDQTRRIAERLLESSDVLDALWRLG